MTAADLQAVGAMAALLKDAMKPNLIQTLEHTPALVHGGPFANIAHGCNSVRATRTALKMADYVITEAGFGADLGAEKFFDIKCRMAGLKPDAVVLVATVRALKYNGGVAKENLSGENMQALRQGIGNLEKHIENLRQYGVPIVVTLNSFVTDTQAETDFVKRFCEERGCEFALSEVWEKGGAGGTELASKVLKTLEEKESRFEVLYEDTLSLQEKIETIASRIYGADGVTYTAAAEAAAESGEAGFRESAGLHGQDPVFPVGRSGASGPAGGLSRQCAGGVCIGRRRICGSTDGCRDDDAGTAEEAGSLSDRRRRKW